MTIRKGEAWGWAAPLPDDGVIVASDAEAGAIVTAARRRREPPPTVGIVGGDLCRTVGGPGDRARLRSSDAMTFPVDLGEVLLDGRLHFFVAHLVARNRWWTHVFVAMNAQWRGPWNLGPRAHPDDGLLDTYEAHLTVGDLSKIRRRLPTGTHLPHPRIRERRVAAAQVEFDDPVRIELDGEPTGRARAISVRVAADGLRVVI